MRYRMVGKAQARMLGLSMVLLCGSVSGAICGPQNVGETKSQAVVYHDYGGYDRDIAAVDAQAQQYVLSQAKQVKNPALVLDIDETSLSNWPQIRANDFGYIANGPCNLDAKGNPIAPCGNLAWDQSHRATAIGPTLALFNAAKANGVAVFFITGRHESERSDTEATLMAAGYNGWDGLAMRPDGVNTTSAADFKAPERAKIQAKGYTIIANVGDQPSDLDRGLSDRAFLLPNPFYRIP
ncbi:MAG TPA: HAD family acid phosphatase [Rhizomicrobium sp.]|nr:HAD family acid phosphatase [Rhizomicrobium sp.]